MSVNINHQLEQVNNLKITAVGTGATVGSAGIVTYYGDGSNITGISTLNIVNYSAGGGGGGGDAATLDGLDSLQFLRSDFADIKTVGDLRFNNNIGITFGGSDNSRLFHDGTDLSLDLTAYVTDFKIRDGTTERYTFTKAGQLSLVDVNASGIVTATSFVKTGGTSSQYLMADGSVSTGGGGGGGGASAINDLSDAINTGESVGLGTGTLVSDDGSTNRNTAIGHNSLNATTTGQRNVAMGYSAGYAVDTGTNHVLLGASAGQKLTSQSGNVFIGEGSGQGVIGMFANANVAVGRNSLGRIGSVTAGGSVAIGENCLVAVTDGFYNVGIGLEAGDRIDTGDNNVCIGRQAGDDITSGDNNICIGYGSSASSSTVDNEITLGNDDITKFRIPGINVVLKDNGGTPTQGHVLTVDGSGEASFAAASGGGGGIGTATTRSVNSYTATASQTLFPPSGTVPYTVGYIDVYLNGSKLDSSEFTASNGTTVTLTTGASLNDIVELVAYENVSINDIVVINDTSPKLGGDLDVNNHDITGTGNMNITGIATANGGQLQTESDVIALAIALG